MRNHFVLFVCAVSFGFIISGGPAQVSDPKTNDEPQKVLDRLLKGVKQKDDAAARIQAITDLAEFGPKAEPAIADLIDALQTKNEDMRLNAAITLSKIGKPAVAPVAKLLTSDDSDAKFYAIWTLGWIGPDAKETAPTMIKLMTDKNDGVRRKAAFALGRLAGDPDKAMEVLLAAFKDESPEVRQAAGDALAKFGKIAVPPLIELLKTDNIETWMQASIALGEIGADAQDAVPLLKDPFWRMAGRALITFRIFSPRSARPPFPRLKRASRAMRPTCAIRLPRRCNKWAPMPCRCWSMPWETKTLRFAESPRRPFGRCASATNRS